MLNNLVLFVLLLLLFLVSFFKNGKKLFFPSTVIAIVFTLSSFLLLISYGIWQYEMHIETILILIFFLAVFTFFNSIFYKSFAKKGNSESKGEPLLIKKNVYAVLSFFSIVLSAYYCYCQFSISIQLNGGLSDMLNTLRHAATDYNVNVFARIGYIYSKALCIVAIFVLTDSIVFKKKNKLLASVPIISFIACTFFSTSRIGFLWIGAIILMDLFFS